MKEVLQAALAIRGFGYPRFHFCITKFSIRVFTIDYLRFFVHYALKTTYFCQYSVPSVSVTFRERNPSE